MQSLQVFQVHFHAVNLFLLQLKSILLDLDLLTWKTIEEHRPYCHIHETNLRRLLWHGAMKGCTQSERTLMNTDKNYWFILTGPKSIKKTVPNIGLLTQSRLGLWILLAVLSICVQRDPSDQLPGFGAPVPTTASAICSWPTEVEASLIFL